MKENRNALIQIRCTPKEKKKIHSWMTLMNENSVSAMMLSAIREYAQNRVKVDLDEFTREREK